VIGSELGRYVNDVVASEANCKLQVMVGISKDPPRLALYATRKITKEEELRFDYGVPNLPWLSLVIVLYRLLYLLDLTAAFDTVDSVDAQT